MARPTVGVARPCHRWSGHPPCAERGCREWTTSVACSGWPSSRPHRPATRGSSSGSRVLVRWPGRASKEPAPMARAWPASCVGPGSRSSKWTGPTASPAGAPASRIPRDAIEAARAALSGRAQGAGKSQRRQRRGHPGPGGGQALSARSSKIKTLNQIRHLGFTRRRRLARSTEGVSRRAPRHHGCAVAALGPGLIQVTFATKTALRTLGQRVLALDDEKALLDELLGKLVRKTAPPCSRFTASEWTPPPPCSSPPATTPSGSARRRPGPTCAGWPPSRPPRARSCALRLNRGGDRQANTALWGIVITRMRTDSGPRPTWSAGSKKAGPRRRSSGSSSATWPGRSTRTCRSP